MSLYPYYLDGYFVAEIDRRPMPRLTWIERLINFLLGLR